MKLNKKYLIIFSAVIIILAVIILYFIFEEGGAEKEIIIDNEENKVEELSYLEIKSDEENYPLALANQDTNLCLNLNSDYSKLFCLKNIALNLKSTSTCALIVDTEQSQACVNNVLLDKIILEKDLPACENISEYISANFCVIEIAKADKTAKCEALKDFGLWAQCSSTINYNQAKEKQDAKICLTIPSAVPRANCLSELDKIDLHSDEDKDGLSFLEEITNNTDPSKADSDGDSYLDIDEISSGFNPTGSGAIKDRFIRCSEIFEPELKTICETEFKTGFFEASRCQAIADQRLLRYCNDRMAEFNK